MCMAIGKRKAQLFHQDKRQISYVTEGAAKPLSSNGVQCTISGREKLPTLFGGKCRKKSSV